MDLPRRVDKPWGHELWYALTDRYAGKILHVSAGHRLSPQFHHDKDESNYLLSGRLKLIKGTSADDLIETEIGPGHLAQPAGRDPHDRGDRRRPGPRGLDPGGRRRPPALRQLRARGHDGALSVVVVT